MTNHFTMFGKAMVLGTCPTCGTYHAFEESIYVVARQQRPNYAIMCPHGHSWHYKDDRELRNEELVRLERDRLKQQLAQKDDEIAAAKKEAKKAEAKVKRIEKRVHAGVCTCCNRHFTNLERHMKTKHKEMAA